MTKLFTPDVEFYHDKGGITLGRDALLASIRDTIATPGRKLRREEVPGTVNVFLLRKDGAVYGAVESGEHLFYLTETGKPEYLDGRARFVTLWLKHADTFVMARELSFDHQPAIPERTAISLSDTELNQCAGEYNAEHTGPITVRRHDGHLLAIAGKNSYELLPDNKTTFSCKAEISPLNFNSTVTLRPGSWFASTTQSWTRRQRSKQNRVAGKIHRPHWAGISGSEWNLTGRWLPMKESEVSRLSYVKHFKKILLLC